MKKLIIGIIASLMALSSLFADQYTAVVAISPYYLNESVNMLMMQGWKCQGGASMSWNGSEFYYVQAMVKETKGDEPQTK